MNDLRDTIQVGLANGSAIGFTLASANEILSFVALILSIAYTIYKFFKFEENQFDWFFFRVTNSYRLCIKI